MNIFKNLFKSSGRLELPKIKRAIFFKGVTIKLYELDRTGLDMSRNIEAFDQYGNLLWIVEKPHSLHYWDMQIDEDSGELDVDSGSGMHYCISLTDGHIISQRLIK